MTDEPETAFDGSQQSRRSFLGKTAGLVGAGAVTLLSPETVSPQSAKTKSLIELLSPHSGIDLVNQEDKKFNPNNLNGKVVIALSGFKDCQACKKIHNTLKETWKKLSQEQQENVHVVMFNLLPEDDFKNREAYAKSYTDIGIPSSNLHLLFTKKNGKPDNVQANLIENSLMNDTTGGHSTSIFVFDKKGNRVGKGTFAVIKPDDSKKLDEAVEKIKTEVQNAFLVKSTAALPQNHREKLLAGLSLQTPDSIGRA